MIFAKPYLLLLLLLLIPIIVWYVWKRKSVTAKMQISSVEPFIGAKRTYKYYLLHFPFALKMIALAMVIVIMARPQAANEWDSKNAEGIDCVLALDISASMMAQDLKPNRLKAAKEVAGNFVQQRTNDNIGLVVFSGAASISFSVAPFHVPHLPRPFSVWPCPLPRLPIGYRFWPCPGSCVWSSSPPP